MTKASQPSLIENQRRKADDIHTQAPTLQIEGVSDTTSTHIVILNPFYFLKLLLVSTCQCQVQCMCLC